MKLGDRHFRQASIVVCGLFIVLAAGAEAQAPRRSQQAETRQRIGNAWVSVKYSRPVARGRDLFGALVPWGRVWCPGADSATALTTTAPLTVEGLALPAGSYSIFAIPDSAGAWTVIFSRAHPIWHVPYPGEQQDALRVQVRARPAEHMEALAWHFPVVEGLEATLAMHWGTVSVPLRLAVQSR